MTISDSSSPFRIAIAATFTSEPLRRFVAFWSQEIHAGFDLVFAPYNQVPQTLLDPASVFGTNTHGVNVVLLRLEDLSADGSTLESNVSHIAEQLRAAGSLPVPLLVTLCPSLPGSVFATAFARMESLLAASLEESPGAQFIPHHCVERLYPVTDPHSPEGEKLGRIPYSEAWFCALGSTLVRHTHALFRAPFKLIALDCDNTLWQGICGEDGPENVVLDPGRRALHEFMLDQREDGVLLAMNSKNNEEDV
ncbi:MAG: hypothetical protein H7039_05490, partial [Bryobacteraceae bacterium]|nr:hypothetical protein [Bryobacteraceae bacterium]